jgi:hypothetical protein
MADVLFISETKLKSFTALDYNVRPEQLVPYVIQSQDIYLQPVLGTRFYKGLKDRIANNTKTQEETDLINDYIAPMILNYALYQALPFLKYRLVQKGVVSPQSETSETASLEELTFLRNSVKDTAEFYQSRLVEFFYDNPSLFPEYRVPGTDGMYPDKSPGYETGLVIPKKSGCGLFGAGRFITDPELRAFR